MFRKKNEVKQLLKGLISNPIAEILLNAKQDTVHELSKELNLSTPKEASELLKILKKVNSITGRLWQSLKVLKSLKVILITSIAAFVGLIISYIIPYAILDGVFKGLGVFTERIFHVALPFILGLLPILKKIVPHYKRLTKIFTQMSNYSKSKIEEKLFILEEKEKIAGVRLKHAEENFLSTQRELRDIEEGKKLMNFIHERSSSEDYFKHLGIISTIRRDLETLRKELIEVGEGNYLRIERIILYIDDLDRCPEEKVLEVLEAVHLLLGMDLFVVIVAVDPRWVSHSLQTKYSKLLGPIEDNYDNKSLSKANAYDYLEKIFQIPFVVKPINKKGTQLLLEHLFDGQVLIPNENYESNEINSNQETSISKNLNQILVTGPSNESVTLLENKEIAKESIPAQTIKISIEELEYMKAMADIIGPTPRTVKRYVNIYRILRAHKETPVFSTEILPDFKAIMFLLAIVVGNGGIAKKVFEKIEESDAEALVDLFNNLQFLSAFSNYKRFDLIKAFILEKDNAISSIKVNIVKKYIPLVSKFSFRTL